MPVYLVTGVAGFIGSNIAQVVPACMRARVKKVRERFQHYAIRISS